MNTDWAVLARVLGLGWCYLLLGCLCGSAMFFVCELCDVFAVVALRFW